jgi:hypothetical protein
MYSHQRSGLAGIFTTETSPSLRSFGQRTHSFGGIDPIPRNEFLNLVREFLIDGVILDRPHPIFEGLADHVDTRDQTLLVYDHREPRCPIPLLQGEVAQ